MIWSFEKLVAAQKDLDQKFFKKSNHTYTSTTAYRQMALSVEICEWANEIRFFKFWSNKAMSDHTVVLDELADVLHFALTFIIQYDGQTTFDVNPPQLVVSKQQTTTLFQELLQLSLRINDGPSANQFMYKLLELAVYLGFNQEQIIEAYFAKSEVNTQRSNSNY